MAEKTVLSPFDADTKLKLMESFLSINSTQSLVVTCVFREYMVVNRNPAFQQNFADIDGPFGYNDIRNLIHPQDLNGFTDNCAHPVENFQRTIRFQKSDGGQLELFSYLIHFRLNDTLYHCFIGYEKTWYEAMRAAPSLNGKTEPDSVHRLDANSSEDAFANQLLEIVEIASADFKYTYVNERGCKFFGKSVEEITGCSTLDTIYEEDVARAVEIMAPVMTGQAETFEMDIRSVRWDGVLVWMNFTGRSIIDENGRIAGYFSVGRDISARKQAEENLKYIKSQLEEKVSERTRELETANRLLSDMYENIQGVFMSIPAGVLVIGRGGEITARNAHLKKTLGIATGPVTRQLQEEIRQRENFHFRKLFDEEASFQDVEMSFPLSGGRKVSCFVTGVPLQRGDGGEPSAVVILRSSKEVHGLVSQVSGNAARFHFRDIISKNARIRATIDLAKRAAGNLGNILITGESGTGKELFAQSIHNHSSRRGGPFIGVNCGAIPRELIASELFGYAEGAFTGSRKGGKIGKFELAKDGTLFLDEIGDMPLEQQVVLLRALQEKCFTKVGGNTPVPFNCRIICATNKNLLQEIEKNNFRKDLFYRINVISLHIAPLRDRKDDIPLLVDYHLDRLRAGQEEPDALPDAFLPYFQAYHWPGNIRELQNVVERLYYLSKDAPLSLEHLPEEMVQSLEVPEAPAAGRLPEAGLGRELQGQGQPSPRQEPRQVARSQGTEPSRGDAATPETGEPGNIREILSRKKAEQAAAHRQEILELLDAYDGNISRVARELGIARSTLYARMR